MTITSRERNPIVSEQENPVVKELNVMVLLLYHTNICLASVQVKILR
jgi:hypothetical protein